MVLSVLIVFEFFYCLPLVSLCPSSQGQLVIETSERFIILDLIFKDNSTVCEELEVSVVDLTVENGLLMGREAEPVKRIFATVKSTIDTSNSSNTVLLFLFLWNSPNVYTLVWKHTNKWRNICSFQIPSAKKIVRQIHNWHRQLFKCSQCII